MSSILISSNSSWTGFIIVEADMKIPVAVHSYRLKVFYTASTYKAYR